MSSPWWKQQNELAAQNKAKEKPAKEEKKIVSDSHETSKQQQVRHSNIRKAFRLYVFYFYV